MTQNIQFEKTYIMILYKSKKNVTFLTVPANILTFSQREETSTWLKEPSASRQQEVMSQAEEYV
jgi:hypothetical protein